MTVDYLSMDEAIECLKVIKSTYLACPHCASKDIGNSLVAVAGIKKKKFQNGIHMRERTIVTVNAQCRSCKQIFWTGTIERGDDG